MLLAEAITHQYRFAMIDSIPFLLFGLFILFRVSKSKKSVRQEIAGGWMRTRGRVKSDAGSLLLFDLIPL
jgi:hypothetical protein